MDFQRLFYINHEFENRTFDWVRLIFFLFGEFDFVRLPNSIEFNPPIEFDWVRFSSIGFDLLCRGLILVILHCRRSQPHGMQSERPAPYYTKEWSQQNRLYITYLKNYCDEWNTTNWNCINPEKVANNHPLIDLTDESCSLHAILTQMIRFWIPPMMLSDRSAHTACEAGMRSYFSLAFKTRHAKKICRKLACVAGVERGMG